MFEGALQPIHWLVVAGIALIIFGPQRLPELGKALGGAIRGFKTSMKEAESGESTAKDGGTSSGRNG